MEQGAIGRRIQKTKRKNEDRAAVGHILLRKSQITMVMPANSHLIEHEGGGMSASPGFVRRHSSSRVGRMDFRHASGHLSERRPGYYLILLRNEIRHRSLRDKPALNV